MRSGEVQLSDTYLMMPEKESRSGTAPMQRMSVLANLGLTLLTCRMRRV